MLLLFKQNTIFSEFILETPAIIKRGECYQNKPPKLTTRALFEQPVWLLSCQAVRG